MRFKVDENLPIEVAEVFRAAGHDATTVNDEGIGGAHDPDIASILRRENRAIVTLDVITPVFGGRNGSPTGLPARWSEVNLKRAAELRAEGRMQAAGLAALQRPEAPSYSYESPPRALSRALLKRFRARPEAWRFFQSQPEGYRRTCTFWVMSAKRSATQEARFGVLLACSEAGERIPLLRRTTPRHAKRR